MSGCRGKCTTVIVIIFSSWISFYALNGLLKPVTNGCAMTYMYPTYIPVSTSLNASSAKYRLFLYHEGWKQIDFEGRLKKLTGIPVLFIPGNGGSYKQVRSLGAESHRAYQEGPPELTFYQEASLTPEEEGRSQQLEELYDFRLPEQYVHMLDWFAVDLKGEHSAMDCRILEEHTEYVVYAIHRILDLYKESYDAQSNKSSDTSGSLPRSVVLVGHSMGGFVARAAVVHPQLREMTVETIITLSSPHQLPPVAVQPSLGHFYSLVNREWRKGYGIEASLSSRWISHPALSHVVVVSVCGGIHDYQVRTKMASLEGIVPPTHGFMIASTGMKNAWLSMEHQTILWCNQLVVQMSHTLLSLIDPMTGLPFASTQKRLVVLSKMLRSGISQSFNWMLPVQPLDAFTYISVKNDNIIAGSQIKLSTYCPPSIHWAEDGLERDLYIQGTTVTILAMDGRRRWMDIRKLGYDNKRHFMFVTNLTPCTGVRIHLWPERSDIMQIEIPSRRRILEVTRKMVQLPAEPAPKLLEPGSQTEQVSPSAMLHLSPDDMRGFHFLTVSVALRPTTSGRPPPPASMAVGQFFNPEQGVKRFSPWLLLSSFHFQKEFLLEENHPIAVNLCSSISSGLLPVTLTLRIVGCGIDSSVLQVERDEDEEQSRLCKLRCFPPLALAWSSTSGLHVFANLYSQTIIVDSSPAFWGSMKESDQTAVLLLVDPHCAYVVTSSISLASSISRFFLLYCSQIINFSVAVVFFSLMHQARSWELDLSVPSFLMSLGSNLGMPLPFLFLAILPILVSFVFLFIHGHPLPSFASYAVVALICYIFANGTVIVLALVSNLILHVGATLHVLLKLRWRAWEETPCLQFFGWLMSCFFAIFSFKVMRVLRSNPALVVALVSICLVSCVHPAVGLTVMLLSHVSSCHVALCSHVQRKEYETKVDRSGPVRTKPHCSIILQKVSDSDEPGTARSFSNGQLEIFNYRHGLLILNLIAVLMFAPSFVAWLQTLRVGQSFPNFLDSTLCIGVILHGLCNWKPGFRNLAFSLPGSRSHYGLSFIYLLAGYYCVFSAISLAPYQVFYAIAAIGAMSCALRTLERMTGQGVNGYFRNGKKRSHKH